MLQLLQSSTSQCSILQLLQLSPSQCSILQLLRLSISQCRILQLLQMSIDKFQVLHLSWMPINGSLISRPHQMSISGTHSFRPRQIPAIGSHTIQFHQLRTSKSHFLHPNHRQLPHPPQVPILRNCLCLLQIVLRSRPSHCRLLPESYAPQSHLWFLWRLSQIWLVSNHTNRAILYEVAILQWFSLIRSSFPHHGIIQSLFTHIMIRSSHMELHIHLTGILPCRRTTVSPHIACRPTKELPPVQVEVLFTEMSRTTRIQLRRILNMLHTHHKVLHFLRLPRTNSIVILHPGFMTFIHPYQEGLVDPARLDHHPSTRLRHLLDGRTLSFLAQSDLQHHRSVQVREKSAHSAKSRLPRSQKLFRRLFRRRLFRIKACKLTLRQAQREEAAGAGEEQGEEERVAQFVVEVVAAEQAVLSPPRQPPLSQIQHTHGRGATRFYHTPKTPLLIAGLLQNLTWLQRQVITRFLRNMNWLQHQVITRLLRNLSSSQPQLLTRIRQPPKPRWTKNHANRSANRLAHVEQPCAVSTMLTSISLAKNASLPLQNLPSVHLRLHQTPILVAPTSFLVAAILLARAPPS